MKIFTKYINTIKEKDGQDIAHSTQLNSLKVSHDSIDKFEYTGNLNIILLGHVQSGKTGTLIGVVAYAIDQGLKFILILTGDNILLYRQTFKRFSEYLPDIKVLGESDQHSFVANSLREPCVVLLKKNQSVLKTWLKLFKAVHNCPYEPLILVDDEADSASLNTLVNKSRKSTINSLIRDTLNSAHSSIYIQTTATPFGNLLLNESSKTNYDLITRFEPSQTYLGGDFFYGEDSEVFELISEDETSLVLSTDSSDRPEGLYKAICYYISHVIYYIENGNNNDNFLIHPSHKVADHVIVANQVSLFLAEILSSVKDKMNLVLQLFPSISANKFYTFDQIEHAISMIRVVVVNSGSELPAITSGFHIIIGGNCLGRGLTIPQLNVFYYTRTAKTPQADTLLQHSRMFGYDRDKKYAKVFLTKSMLLNFRGISSAIESLHKHVENRDLANFKFFLPPNIAPTRKNVIDKSTYITLSGGVNYFISSSSPKNTTLIDSYLSKCTSGITYDISWLVTLLDIFESDDPLLEKFKYASNLLIGSSFASVKVFIRLDRNISKGTGTMLSPDDRILSRDHPQFTKVFLYRLVGKTSHGWAGKPMWLVNIKFPDDCIFIGMDESNL